MASSANETPSNMSLSSGLPKVRAGSYFYWEEGQLDNFRSWWKTTLYAISHPKKGRHNWGCDNHTAGLWDSYHECAQILAGEPGMACKACLRILGHPSVRDKRNTLLYDHFTTACPKRSGGSHVTQLLLPHLLKKVHDNLSIL